MGFTVAPLTAAVMGAVDPRHAGVASGINNAVARTAGLLAVAALGLLLLYRFNQALDGALAPLSLDPAIAHAVDAQRVRLGGADFSAFAPALRAPLHAAFTAAYVAAFRTLMFASAVLAALAGAAGLAGGLSWRSRTRPPCPTRRQRPEAPETSDGGAIGESIVKPTLELLGATKRYDGKTVLEPLDLQIGHGETVGLIGPSGSGKTTILRLALGLLTPDAGVVRFRGAPLAPSNVRAARQQMGYVVQDGGLFPHLTAAAKRRADGAPPPLGARAARRAPQRARRADPLPGRRAFTLPAAALGRTAAACRA